MEFRVLQYFLTVAQEESISRAAERLHLTQPTLSRQIAQLEEELGAPLFIRGKRTTLTEAGMMLRHKAEEVSFLMDSIRMDFQSRKDMSGIIRIGSGVYSGSNSVMAQLKPFMEKYPGVRFEIHTASADILKERLDHGMLDFVILQEPINIGSYDYIRLRTKDRWGLITAADSPWAAKESVTREDLSRMHFMISSRASVQGEVRNWYGAELPQPAVTGNLADNLLPLIEGGLDGLVAVEAPMAYFDPGRFRFVPFTPELTTTTVLAWKKLNPVFGPAREYLAYVKRMHQAYEKE